MITIPKKLERKIALFAKYLQEVDAENALSEYYPSMPTFYQLRWKIDDVTHFYPKRRLASRLTQARADTLAWQLGEELMAAALLAGQKEFKEFPVTSGSSGFCDNPRGVDWHVVMDVG